MSLNQSELKSIDINKHPECRYIPIVIGMTKRFLKAYHYNLPGLDEEDLINIGWLVLKRCFKNYDPEKGNMSRYVTTAIYNSFTEILVENRSMIKVRYGIDKKFVQSDSNVINDLSYNTDYDRTILLDDILKLLPPKAYRVVCLINGIGCKQHNMIELSQMTELWGGKVVSKQNVQQYYVKCLKRLRRLLPK